MGSREDDIDFDFEPEDVVGISPIGRNAIELYVDVLSDVFLRAALAAGEAVNNFETSMSNESTADANPDVLGSMLSAAIDSSISGFLKGVGKHFPAVPTAFKVFEALGAELDRAAKAASSVKVRDFIIDQREAVARIRDQFDRIAVTDEVSFEFSVDEPEDVTSERLRSQAQELSANADSVDLQKSCEQKIWEQWMRAHFTGHTEDAFGCIEVVFEPQDDGASLRSVKVAMPGSMKGKITDALKRIMSRRASVRSPLDFRVVKRIKFINVENLVGGTQDDFGWLDERNGVVHEPFFDDAKRVFRSSGWQHIVRSFK